MGIESIFPIEIESAKLELVSHDDKSVVLRIVVFDNAVLRSAQEQTMLLSEVDFENPNALRERIDGNIEIFRRQAASFDDTLSDYVEMLDPGEFVSHFQTYERTLAKDPVEVAIALRAQGTKGEFGYDGRFENTFGWPTEPLSVFFLDDMAEYFRTGSFEELFNVGFEGDVECYLQALIAAGPSENTTHFRTAAGIALREGAQIFDYVTDWFYEQARPTKLEWKDLPTGEDFCVSVRHLFEEYVAKNIGVL